MYRYRRIPPAMILIIGSSMFVWGLSQKQPKVNSPSSTVWKQPAQGQPDDYAGADVCAACHSAHLTEAVGVKDKTEAPLAQAHFFRSPRIAEENRWLTQSLLRQSQPQLCYSCHSTVQAQFALPTHHRVPEGLLKCTDCHNAHGTNNQPMLRKTAWEVCVDCHTEKRGPFVFEHAAVKVEGCAGCHSPHGTVNRQLLLRREGRFLCLQCHVDPFAPNVPHGRLGFPTKGECARCHVAVHGSNFNQFLLN